jgi:hypothetical protein
VKKKSRLYTPFTLIRKRIDVKDFIQIATPTSKPDEIKSQITVISLEIEGNLSNFCLTGTNVKENLPQVKEGIEEDKKNNIDQHSSYDQRRVVNRSSTYQISNNVNNDKYYCHKCNSFSCNIL